MAEVCTALAGFALLFGGITIIALFAYRIEKRDKQLLIEAIRSRGSSGISLYDCASPRCTEISERLISARDAALPQIDEDGNGERIAHHQTIPMDEWILPCDAAGIEPDNNFDVRRSDQKWPFGVRGAVKETIYTESKQGKGDSVG